jgi:hypothetical protein
MKTITFLYITFGFLICLNNAFSQQIIKTESDNSNSNMTEYDYYENLRLKVKSNKVKSLKVFDIRNDDLKRIDYYDEEGYLVKREFYSTGYSNSIAKLFSEFIITPYDNNLNVSISETGYSDDGSSNFNVEYINNYKFFMELETETTEEEVKFVFDESDQFIEKQIFFGEDGDYNLSRKETFIYDANGLLVTSEIISGNSKFVTKYTYNNKELLEKEEVKKI